MSTTHEKLTMNGRGLVKYWDPGEGNSSSPVSFMNDFTIIQHTDGVWHIFGIKKAQDDWPTGHAAFQYGRAIHHQTSTDLHNWTVQAELSPDDLDDVSFATHQWGRGPHSLWAPHVIVNPTKDTASTAHSERYVMAMTAVYAEKKYAPWAGAAGFDGTSQLIVFGYSDDLYTWTWDSTAIYDPLNATDHGADTFTWIQWVGPGVPEYQAYTCKYAHTGDGAATEKPEEFEQGVTDGVNKWWEYTGEASAAFRAAHTEWADSLTWTEGIWRYQYYADSAHMRDPNFFQDPADSAWYLTCTIERNRGDIIKWGNGDLVWIDFGSGSPQVQAFICITDRPALQNPPIQGETDTYWAYLGEADNDFQIDVRTVEHDLTATYSASTTHYIYEAAQAHTSSGLNFPPQDATTSTHWHYVGTADTAAQAHLNWWLNATGYQWYVGAMTRLKWGGTTDFSAGWALPTPGSATGATFIEYNAGTDLPEGSGVIHTPDSNQMDHYWVRRVDLGSAGTGGGGYRVSQYRDTNDVPWPRRNHGNVVGEWKHSLGFGSDASNTSDDHERAWGSVEMVETSTSGKWVAARFIQEVAEDNYLREKELRYGIIHIDEWDFTQKDATDDSPLMTLKTGLSPDDWPVKWGTAFNDQPTFGDPKSHTVDTVRYNHSGGSGWLKHTCILDHTSADGREPDDGEANTWWDAGVATVTQDFTDYETWDNDNHLYYTARDLSDVVINGGNRYTCIATHTAASASEPGVGADTATYWNDDGAYAGTDIDSWVSGTTYTTQAGTSANLDGWYYIDTWEKRPGPWLYYGESEQNPTTNRGMTKTGYIKSKVWTLQGDRIGLKVGGGTHAKEFVALVEAESDRCIFVEYGDGGNGTPNFAMTSRLWDITSLKGTKVYVCIADMHTKAPSGWISCDTIHEYSYTDPDEEDAQAPTLPTAQASRPLVNALMGIEVSGTTTTDHAAYVTRDSITAAATASASSITKGALYDAVAARLKCEREDCLPLAAEMDEWALDCLRWLLPLAPEASLESLISTTTKANGVAVSQVASDILKVVRVSHGVFGDPCQYVSPDRYAAISQALSSTDYYLALQPMADEGYYGRGNRVWSDIMGKVQVYRAGKTDAINIDYISNPAWASSSLSIPHGWEPLLALYVAIQLRLKQGLLQEVQALQQALQAELLRFRGMDDVPVTVGG